jgi:hypothetical protein
LSFDKDDDDTLDFVVATSNLRAIAYGIPKKTRFEVKGKLLTACDSETEADRQKWQAISSQQSRPPTQSLQA